MAKKVIVKSGKRKGPVPRSKVKSAVKKVMKNIVETVPASWNKKVLEAKVFHDDGTTVKWNIVVFQNGEDIFSVDEDTKITFGLPCLSTGKTMSKALKKFMKKEDELYKKKMDGANYSK